MLQKQAAFIEYLETLTINNLMTCPVFSFSFKDEHKRQQDFKI